MVRRELFRWVVVTLLLLVATTAQAQSDDSLVVRTETGSPHSPTGALWRSAIVPGWGQAYNRQYLKVPVVLAAMGGLTALVIHNDNEFDRYNHAYLFGVYMAEDPHPFPDFEAEYRELSGFSTSALRSNRDQFRRNRDLTVIGLVVAYGFTLLDAYVSGQLVDFDVGEDLSALHSARPLPLKLSFRYRF